MKNSSEKIVKLWDELTPKQKVTRWKHAVRVLEEMGEHEITHHFDMNTWGEQTPCGTVGCAAGQCGLDPKIRKMGFKLNFSTTGRTEFSVLPGNFFGWDAYHDIFTDDDLIDMKGKKAHTKVLKKMREYLEELKEDAGIK